MRSENIITKISYLDNLDESSQIFLFKKGDEFVKRNIAGNEFLPKIIFNEILKSDNLIYHWACRKERSATDIALALKNDLSTNTLYQLLLQENISITEIDVIFQRALDLLEPILLITLVDKLNEEEKIEICLKNYFKILEVDPSIHESFRDLEILIKNHFSDDPLKMILFLENISFLEQKARLMLYKNLKIQEDKLILSRLKKILFAELNNFLLKEEKPENKADERYYQELLSIYLSSNELSIPDLNFVKNFDFLDSEISDIDFVSTYFSIIEIFKNCRNLPICREKSHVTTLKALVNNKKIYNMANKSLLTFPALIHSEDLTENEYKEISNFMFGDGARNTVSKLIRDEDFTLLSKFASYHGFYFIENVELKLKIANLMIESKILPEDLRDFTKNEISTFLYKLDPISKYINNKSVLELLLFELRKLDDLLFETSLTLLENHQGDLESLINNANKLIS